MPGSLAFHESTPGKTILQEAINNSNVTVEDVFGNIIAMFDSDASDTKRNKSDRQYYLVFKNGTSTSGANKLAPEITVDGAADNIDLVLLPKGNGFVVIYNVAIPTLYVNDIYEYTTGHNVVIHNNLYAPDIYADYFYANTQSFMRFRTKSAFSEGPTTPALSFESGSGFASGTIVAGPVFIGHQNDNSGIGTVAPIYITNTDNDSKNVLVVQSPVAATSEQTGALQVSGGAGIIGDLYVGGTIHSPYITKGTVDVPQAYISMGSGFYLAGQYSCNAAYSISHWNVLISLQIYGLGTGQNQDLWQFTLTLPTYLVNNLWLPDSNYYYSGDNYQVGNFWVSVPPFTATTHSQPGVIVSNTQFPTEVQFMFIPETSSMLNITACGITATIQFTMATA